MADEDEILRCAQDDTVEHLRGMRIIADVSAFGGESDGRIHSLMSIIGPRKPIAYPHSLVKLHYRAPDVSRTRP